MPRDSGNWYRDEGARDVGRRLRLVEAGDYGQLAVPSALWAV